MIDPADKHPLLEKICVLAKVAGEKIMPFYRQAQQITHKEDKSPLTAADLASHQYLAAALAGLVPDCPVVSEESEADARSTGAKAGRFWLVDPLDGTKEFLKGTDEFTVNIALIEEKRPILGVVYAPALNRSYFAGSGLGVWRQEADGVPERIASRRTNRLQAAVVASKDHAGPQVQAMLSKLPGAVLRSMGSSLKFCLVAEGTADIYLRDVPTMEWDTAAAQCIVETAGGGVFTLDGKTLPYAKNGLKNPSIMTVGDKNWSWIELTQACSPV